MATIDEMSAEKDMNALIAEKVFGWKNLHWKEGGSGIGESGYYVSWPTGWYGHGPNGETYLTKSYRTDIGAAWEIVQKMSVRYCISIHDMSKNGTLWQCSFEIRDNALRYPIELAHPGDEFADAETPSLAICLCTLRALGIPRTELT